MLHVPQSGIEQHAGTLISRIILLATTNNEQLTNYLHQTDTIIHRVSEPSLTSHLSQVTGIWPALIKIIVIVIVTISNFGDETIIFTTHDNHLIVFMISRS